MDDAPSEIIDLDPEPATARPRLPWERILGVALLLAVLGFALLDWGQREQQAQIYRQGQLAQTARHWDAARTAYAAVGTYSDAPQRLATVQAQINHRDLLLAQATGATSPRVIWQNLQMASDIEPDYPGLATRLAAARTALFQGGTAGLVYLQKTATQAGLFLTQAAPPATYLPGSDLDSRLRGVAPGGQTFLYDARNLPGNDCGQQPCPPAARRVILAQVDAAGTLTIRPLNALDPNGLGQFTDDASGFWWSEDAGTRYVDLASHQVADLTRPGQDRWVLTRDPTGKRVLLGDQPPGSAVHTLYVAAADGGDERVVAPGLAGDDIVDAAFSPQGHYLMLLVQQSDYQLTHLLWVIDLRTYEPVLLDAISWDPLETVARLSAFFVPGSDPERLLVDHRDERGEWLLLYQLPDETATALWSGPGLARRYQTAAVSPDGRTLAVQDQVDNTGTLVLLSLDGSAAPRTFPTGTYLDQRVNAQFSLNGDFVVYEVLNPDGINRGYTKPLFTLAGEAPDGSAPRLLGSAVMPYDSTLQAVALPPGSELLVYCTSAGELWATTFDGAGSERLVDRGVSAVWSLRDSRAWTWTR